MERLMKKTRGNPWVFGTLLVTGGITMIWAISGEPIPLTDEWRDKRRKAK
jgi:hypothetical protein